MWKWELDRAGNRHQTQTTVSTQAPHASQPRAGPYSGSKADWPCCSQSTSSATHLLLSSSSVVLFCFLKASTAPRAAACRVTLASSSWSVRTLSSSCPFSDCSWVSWASSEGMSTLLVCSVSSASYEGEWQPRGGECLAGSGAYAKMWMLHTYVVHVPGVL